MSKRKGESDESYRARMREFMATPEAKERARARKKTAEYKAADSAAHKARMSDSEFVAARRKRTAERRADPTERERIREAGRVRASTTEVRELRAAQYRERRAAELEALGNPTECGVCGVSLGTHADGRDARRVDHRHDNDVVRGVVCTRCNSALGAIDLRYTDPELWASLLAWSARGEPVLPTGRKRKTHRRMPEPEPDLFADGNQDAPRTIVHVEVM